MKAKEIMDKIKLIDSLSEELFEFFNNEYVDLNCKEFGLLSIWLDEEFGDNDMEERVVEQVSDLFSIIPAVDIDEDCDEEEEE